MGKDDGWTALGFEDGAWASMQWSVSFGGSGEDDDESVRMMDESEVRAWWEGWEASESLREFCLWERENECETAEGGDWAFKDGGWCAIGEARVENF